MKKNTCVYFMLFYVFVAFSQDKRTAFGNVTLEELKEEFYPLDSTAHAAYLYREKTLTYYVDHDNRWAHRTEVYEKIKIYDKKGFDEATKTIFLYKSNGGSKEKAYKIEACTYSLEGDKIVKTKLNKAEVFKEDNGENWFVKKFTMPALKKGVIVEWKYIVSSPFASYIDRFVLQQDIPVKEYSSVLVTPEHFSFKIYKAGSIPISVKKYVRKMKRIEGNEYIYTVEAKGIPAFKEEAYMSNRRNFVSSIDFDFSYYKDPSSSYKEGNVETWEGIAKKILKTSFLGRSLKRKKYFEDDLLGLPMSGKNNKEKIKMILDHVKSKVKWNGELRKSVDVGVKKAYETGEGNSAEINMILIAMLRQAGLFANPVLISTRQHGIALFPSIKAYNHLIVGVEGVNEKPILLDATESYGTLNVLPFRDLNWFGRMVRDDQTTEKIYLNPQFFSLEDQLLKIQISEDLKVKGVLKTTYTANNTLAYKKRIQKLNEEKIKENLENEYNISILNIQTSEKEKDNIPYVRLIELEYPDGVEEIDGKLYISPLLFLSVKTNPFKLDKRDYPVDFGFPWKDNYKVFIKIPENYQVDFLPRASTFKMNDGIGNTSFKIIQQGEILVANYTMQFSTGVIDSKYYNQLKEIYSTSISKQSEKIILSKKK